MEMIYGTHCFCSKMAHKHYGSQATKCTYKQVIELIRRRKHSPDNTKRSKIGKSCIWRIIAIIFHFCISLDYNDPQVSSYNLTVVMCAKMICLLLDGKKIALTSLHCLKSYQDPWKLLQETQRSSKICFGENL